ncbi:MAG: F0F1 ATP synthase subunit epsilon [Saezia sp.]
MTALNVDVVSAEELIFSGKASFVVLPGISGELGILPGHTPLITLIAPGTVRIKRADNGQEELIFVAGGVLEVQPGKVTVLADTAIRGHDLDEAKALAARKSAQDAVANARGKMELAEAKAELAMLAAQVTTIRKAADKKRS